MAGPLPGGLPVKRGIVAGISGALAGAVGKRFVATLIALLFAFVALVSDSALACTVCTGGQEEASRKAFVVTTALLTFLPMVVVGAAVSFFVRRTLDQEKRNAQDRTEPAVPGNQSIV